MCGIVALFRPADSGTPDRELVSRLNDAQFSRGPDEGSVHVESQIGLGHRRLSIIDIATGQQPLFNEDGSVVVVFNGEIYNFEALTRELVDAGHRFATRSDTEVIVHGWEEWGPACVKRFRGMFAFVLWDRRTRTLFAARDRLGVKPLHFASLPDGSWIFGSELKALTAHPMFPRVLDPFAIEDFLALGYVPDPATIWKAAQKLSPAHRLLFRAGQDVAPCIERYWDVSFEPFVNLREEEAAEELRRLLTESVRLRLVAEVPLGAFLSGGVDSSAVVACMAGLDPRPVQTCSIGFDVPAYDESSYARAVAARFRTDHHEHTVTANDFGLLDTLVDLYDEPFADSSAIPTYRLCEAARRHVTVALSGDGGDETFGGYRRYRMHLAEERVRAMLPPSVRRSLFGPLGRWYPKLDWMPRAFRGRTTFQGIANDSATAYFNSVAVIRDENRLALYSPQFLSILGGYRAGDRLRSIAAAAPTDDPLGIVQYLDYQTWLPGDINTKVDRASMAHSLEVREPLMDHLLVEWTARLPATMKIRGQVGKFLFKRALESLLPHDVLYRQKMGFSIPLAEWLRGPLAGRLRACVEGPHLAESGLFDISRLTCLVDEHLSRRYDHSRTLWSLMMLEGFMRRACHGIVVEAIQPARPNRSTDSTRRASSDVI
jgi:asparagine synthase (glutamine-hydrolysing)